MLFGGFFMGVLGIVIAVVAIDGVANPTPEAEAQGSIWTIWALFGFGLLIAIFGTVAAIDQVRRNKKERKRPRDLGSFNPYELLDLARHLTRNGRPHRFLKKKRVAEYGLPEGKIEIKFPIATRWDRLMERLWALGLVEEPRLAAWVSVEQPPIIGENGFTSVIGDSFLISNKDRKRMFHTSHVSRYKPDGTLDIEDLLARPEKREKKEDQAWSRVKYGSGLHDATPEQVEMVTDLLYSLASGESTESHPGAGQYCAICGSETDGEHYWELHAQPTIRFCHVCGANWSAGEPCDAGLHG